MYFENVKAEGGTLYSFYRNKSSNPTIEDSVKFYSKGTQATANDEVAIIEVDDSFNKSDLIIDNIKYDSKNNIFYSIESGKELVYKDIGDGKSIMYAKNADGTIGDEYSNIIFNDKTNAFELKNNGNSGDNGSNTDNGLSDVNLDDLQDHFDSLVTSSNGESLLEQILNNILKGNYKIDLSKLDLANLDLKTLLLVIDENSSDYQSIKQSIEFLTTLYSDEEIKAKLKDWYGNNQNYKDFLAKGKAMQENANNLKNFIAKYGESIKAIKGNANRLNSIIEQIYGKNGLMEAYNAFIEAGLKDEAENTKRQILSLYNEALALEKNLEAIKPIVDKLQVDTPFDLYLINKDKGGTFTFLDGANIKDGLINIPSINKPSFDNNEDNKGDNQDPTLNAPLKDINASMLDKQQVVLIKPAEEEKETLDEEKGVLNQRTCVVSENFKTNNPCMAQRI